ncbi:hypothetical protein [Brevundimonas sp.]|jgi:hypothetical protein|uniref:hypothetical protein n=1 Tax=Brevundimonas sp. TaxID=1871086 RepID=UPI00391B06B8
MSVQSGKVWRSEWGDPTGIVTSAIMTVLLGAGFFNVAETGRVGWPGDTFFAERVDDPIKFYLILAAIGLAGLLTLVFLVSCSWDLIARWRRNASGAP